MKDFRETFDLLVPVRFERGTGWHLPGMPSGRCFAADRTSVTERSNLKNKNVDATESHLPTVSAIAEGPVASVVCSTVFMIGHGESR